MFYTSAFLRKKKTKNGVVWVGVLSYKDADGKWKQKPKSFPECRLKRDAQKALNDWREEEESRAVLQEKGLTSKSAIERYLREEKNLKIISNRTYTNNLRQAQKSIFPAIGEIEFSKLTYQDLQTLVNGLCEKYAPSSVRTIYAIVSKTVKWGVKNHYLLADIAKGVVLPKEGQKRINYLTKEGRKQFLAAMRDEDSQFYLPSMIAYYTGMRAGEICGLRWKDISFPTSSIFLENAMKDYRDMDSGEMVEEISDTKTHKQRRIPLLPQLKTILEKRLEQSNPQADDLVCGIKKPTLLCTSFQKWTTRHQIIGSLGKPVTMHGLRHTFATVGVESGMDIKSLSSILGHSSTAMTLDIYASADEHAKKSSMDKLSMFMEAEAEDEV
ncbi:MAG: tyrosine-type recombinase/integrase [Eggerthellaceae bacterium]|nr:tyrosine-type recombinase/integrase [Eggerthellaceae bacterium]